MRTKNLNESFVSALDSAALLAERAERLELARQRTEEARQHAEAARQSAEVARKHAEVAQLRADDANQAKSAFVANMSHELRTPLTAIIGYAEELLVCDEPKPRISYAEVIRRNGKYLLEILNDVLE